MEPKTLPAEISIAVITVSDRCHNGEREDRSGPAAAGVLERAAFNTGEVRVIPDGAEPVHAALSDAIEAHSDVVLTLGGTGIAPRDQTPEGTRPLIDRELPGVAEGLRLAGAAKVPTAVLSRGLAGTSKPAASGHRAILINLPGSTGGSRDGAEYLAPILPHLVDQLRGGDH